MAPYGTPVRARARLSVAPGEVDAAMGAERSDRRAPRRPRARHPVRPPALGALQFHPGFRERNRPWHRAAGRVLGVLGLLAALTGLWMAHYYPWPAWDGVGVYVERLVAGTAMLASIALGLVAVRRRDFRAHGEWMTRAYALGLGAGTQVLTHIPWFILTDAQPTRTGRTVTMGSAWLINAIAAEWIIRRRRRPRVARVAAVPTAAEAPSPA